MLVKCCSGDSLALETGGGWNRYWFQLARAVHLLEQRETSARSLAFRHLCTV